MRKEIECKLLKNTLPMYSRDDVNAAIEIASKTMKGIVKILADSGNQIGANATENATVSYEQILRASLGLDNKDEVVDRL